MVHASCICIDMHVCKSMWYICVAYVCMWMYMLCVNASGVCICKLCSICVYVNVVNVCIFMHTYGRYVCKCTYLRMYMFVCICVWMCGVYLWTCICAWRLVGRAECTVEAGPGWPYYFWPFIWVAPPEGGQTSSPPGRCPVDLCLCKERTGAGLSSGYVQPGSGGTSVAAWALGLR